MKQIIVRDQESLSEKRDTRTKIKERMGAFLKNNKITLLKPQGISDYNPANTGTRMIKIPNKTTNFLEFPKDSR